MIQTGWTSSGQRVMSVGNSREAASSTTLQRAVDAYLTFLTVERGLASATIRAYRADLADYADSRGTRRDWASGPDAALRYLAARTRRGRRLDPGLAPTSLRRRAAAIKGFYRFAFGEGLIGIDVAAHLDLPRMPRLLPETLTAAETERLLAAPPPEALLDRALLELPYAAGLRVSEALRLDLEDISLDGAFVPGLGQGDRERLVPVGDVALGWLRAYTDEARPAWLAVAHLEPIPGGPGFPTPTRPPPPPQPAW